MANNPLEQPIVEQLRHENSLISLRQTVLSLSNRISSIQSTLQTKIDREEFSETIHKRITTQMLERSAAIVLQHTKLLISELSNEFNTAHKTELTLIRKAVQGWVPNSILIVEQTILPNLCSYFCKQINSLRNIQPNLISLLDKKHKKTVSLNNQVCVKLQKLEETIRILQEKQQQRASNKILYGSNPSSALKKHSATVVTLPKKHQTTFTTSASKQSDKNTTGFQDLRSDLMLKSLQTLQRDLSQKMNIGDLLPVIKKNINPLSAGLEQLRSYLDQNLDSTRRILASQAQINRQLSLACQVGCWHSFEGQLSFALWSRQLYNTIPQQILWTKNDEFVTIKKGFYALKTFIVGKIKDVQGSLQAGQEHYTFGSQLLLRFTNQTDIKVRIHPFEQVVLFIQKLG